MDTPRPTNSFSAWDYVVFAGVLLVSTAIGIYYGCTGGKQKTTQEFLMANRQMTVFPVTLSLLASFMSAITLLGTPAEIYVFGTQYWMIWIGYVLLIPMAAHIFLPVFYNLKLTSVFEYLELRFSRGVRVCAALLYILYMILYMSIVLYTPSLALNVVTKLNVWISVVTVGAVCTFYTTIGGIKAVMWTDVFQVFMMFAGLIAILIKGSLDHGGFMNMWNYLHEGERVEFFDFNPDPLVRHTFWSLSIGGCFTWLAIYGVNQAQIQRALCVPRLRDGQLALWLNLPGLTLLLTVCSLCGMVVYAEYRDCDPLTEPRSPIIAKDQLLPLYVMDRLAYPGLPGLFTACLFSGALSTISSGLNSLSAVTLQDLVRTCCFKNLSEKQATLASKLIAMSYGIIMIGLAFVASQMGGVLQAALGLFGMIGGPLLGLFSLGIIYPWANSKGAYAGLLAGVVLTLWMGLGAQVYKPATYKPPVNITGCLYDDLMMDNYTTMATSAATHTMSTMDGVTEASPGLPSDQPGYLRYYEVSYMWYATFAVFVVTFVGMIVSLITGPTKPRDLDPRLVIPVVANVFCCGSEETRRRMRCGMDDARDLEDNADDKVAAKSDTNGSLEKGYVNPAVDLSTEKQFSHNNTDNGLHKRATMDNTQL